MGSTSNALTVEELVGQWVHSDLSSLRDDQSKCWCRLIYNPKRTNAAPCRHYAHVRRELTIIEELGLGATAEVRVGAIKAKFGLCVELNWNHHHTPPSYHIFCPVGDFLEPVRCSDGPITWISIGFKGYCFGSVVVTNSIFKKSLQFHLWGGCPFIIHLGIPY